MTTPTLPLEEIQGNTLRGYRMPLVRHFVLHIQDAAGAKRFLAGLVGGYADEALRITSSAHWSVKPHLCLNLVFTYEGLKALGLPAASLASFPVEFVQGATDRAALVGDAAESAPEHWISGFAAAPNAPSPAHLLLTLHAATLEVREEASARLRRLFGAEDALTELSHQDGADLPDSRVHFGYVDGLSQPHVEGGPAPRHVGLQPPVPTGEFLLGYPSQYPGVTYTVPTPRELGRNGTFCVYRILKQDVVGFERFLEQAAAENGLDKEWIAAKMCGRWRNGVPLSLSPDSDKPDPPMAHHQLNEFDFVPTTDAPDLYNDSKGLRCPVSSHIRRTNPRSQDVAGHVHPRQQVGGRDVAVPDGGSLRRIIRRAKPYGPAYHHGKTHDEIERGLLLNILCVSILDQFEFIMSQWVNGTIFAAHVSVKDPLIGSNDDPPSNQFLIPTASGKPIALCGFSRFVETRGSLYGFIPSLPAIRYLSDLPN